MKGQVWPKGLTQLLRHCWRWMRRRREACWPMPKPRQNARRGWSECEERAAKRETPPIDRDIVGERRGGGTSTDSGWKLVAKYSIDEPEERSGEDPYPAAGAGGRKKGGSWKEEEDQEWGYAADPGTASLESLPEQFGEASFWDGPSWVAGVNPSLTWKEQSGSREDTHFHLAVSKTEERTRTRYRD